MRMHAVRCSLMLLAAVFATAAAISGLYLSFYLNLASGASIVLIETLFFLVALLFGPRSGLLSGRLARRGSGEVSEAG